MDGNCPRQKLHFRKYKLLQSFKECFWMGIVLGDNYLKSLKETLFKRTKKKNHVCWYKLLPVGRNCLATKKIKNDRFFIVAEIPLLKKIYHLWWKLPCVKSIMVSYCISD